MSYLQMLQSAERDGSTDAPSNGVVQDRVTQPRPTDSEIAQAMRLLNLTGCRIIRNESVLEIGVWEDLDGVEIRQALRTVGLDAHPIVHLESAGVDLRYNVRRTPDRAKGEPFAAWLTRAEEALPAVVAAYQQR
jgi:hypothetical protein